MILSDTSIWIDHMRRADIRLVNLLKRASVLVHPFVVGEISLGSIKEFDAVMEALLTLPKAPVANDEQVRFMIKQHDIMSMGIGYVDAHLLEATMLSEGSRFWTRDKRLKRAVEKMHIAATLD